MSFSIPGLVGIRWTWDTIKLITLGLCLGMSLSVPGLVGTSWTWDTINE